MYGLYTQEVMFLLTGLNFVLLRSKYLCLNPIWEMPMAVSCGLILNSLCIKKVSVAYNNIYRKLLGIRRGVSISELDVHNRLDAFCVLNRKSIYSLQCRLLASHNSIINSIISSLFFLNQSSVNRRWEGVLYLSRV